MGYKFCPKCELNRIPEEEELCPICKKDYEQLKYTDVNKKLCPYCQEEYIPEDQEMCENCFEERLLTGVVDDSEIEEEKPVEELEIFENEFDVLTEEDIIDDLTPDVELDETIDIDEPIEIEEDIDIDKE